MGSRRDGGGRTRDDTKHALRHSTIVGQRRIHSGIRAYPVHIDENRAILYYTTVMGMGLE